ncbi:SPX domain-containing membrane protein At4g11810-like [Euphorbia lathyris]|uniref:SPX domain-containing membrane protein At4g11810-like n=1 Tax=Euphorbia lathyris TaxID=212925 RepID=UPI0033133484
MVAFGKKLKENQIEEWKEYYLNYKLLKKKLNEYKRQIEVGAENQHYVLRDFSGMLDTQIEKIVCFLIQQQGRLASRLLKLGEQHDVLSQQLDGFRISELREAYKVVGRDVLDLLFFVDINATGLRKILKKFDKRFGSRFTDYYVKTRANHPYSQLRQVFKHVGIEAIVGAISRNLADLQAQEGNYISIYDQPAVSNPDSVIDSINAAVNKLSNSTNFLEYT